jgi:hypothetical protein
MPEIENVIDRDFVIYRTTLAAKILANRVTTDDIRSQTGKSLKRLVGLILEFRLIAQNAAQHPQISPAAAHLARWEDSNFSDKVISQSSQPVGIMTLAVNMGVAAPFLPDLIAKAERFQQLRA